MESNMQLANANNLTAGDSESIEVVFQTPAKLKQAMERLTEQGFHGDEISVHTSHHGNLLDDRQESKMGEGIVVGAIAGVVIGVLLCLLAGIEPASLQSSGPLHTVWSALACGMVGGMLGGVTGALIGRGIPEYQVADYDTNLAEGSIVVKVEVNDLNRALRAKAILEFYGGRSVDHQEIQRSA